MELHSLEPLIFDIVRRCQEKGVKVANTLAAFMVRLVLGDRERSSDPESETELKSHELGVFVDDCVKRLCAGDSVELETLKLQVGFDTIFLTEDSKLTHMTQRNKTNEDGLMKLIVSHQLRSASACAELYRNITGYIRARFGIDSQDSLVNMIHDYYSIEALSDMKLQTYLRTVLPKGHITGYLLKSDPERKKFIEDISLVVVGRLLFDLHHFIKNQKDENVQLEKQKQNNNNDDDDNNNNDNTDNGKSGNTISKVFESFVSSISIYLRDLKVDLMEMDDVMKSYVHVLEHSFLRDIKPKAGIQRVRDELTFRRQWYAYIDLLVHDLADLRDRTVELLEIFKARMNEIQNDRKTKNPPGSAKYSTLAQICIQLDLERIQFGIRKNIGDFLKEFRGNVGNCLDEREITFASIACAEKEQKDDADTRETVTRRKDLVILNDPVFSSKKAPSFGFQGFCPWAIVKRDGMLVEGNPSYGVVKYKEQLYVLSSKDRLREFADNPDYFIDGCIPVAEKHPELILLLELRDYFPMVTDYHPLLAENAGGPIVRDSSTQYESNVESNYVQNYQWNEWELRKQAIQLVDLRYKKTTSSQTVLSNFRRENSSQFYAPKDQTTQTGISRGVNTTKKLRVIKGIRGDPNSRVNVVDVCLDA